jgi:hypothetical protein
VKLRATCRESELWFEGYSWLLGARSSVFRGSCRRLWLGLGVSSGTCTLIRTICCTLSDILVGVP